MTWIRLLLFLPDPPGGQEQGTEETDPVTGLSQHLVAEPTLTWGGTLGPPLEITDAAAPQALSTDSVERLPVYNKSAWRHYQTIQEAGDWCVPSTEPKNTSTYRVS